MFSLARSPPLLQPLNFSIFVLSFLPRPHFACPRVQVPISAQTTLCSGDVGLEQVPVPTGGHSCSSETRVAATRHSTPSPAPRCGTHGSHQADPRRTRPHAPDLHASSERGHRNQNTGARCSLLHLFYSRVPGETRSIPLPRTENLNPPAPPWGAQCPPGALCCARASQFAHTHAHTHAPISRHMQ